VRGRRGGGGGEGRCDVTWFRRVRAVEEEEEVRLLLLSESLIVLVL